MTDGRGSVDRATLEAVADAHGVAVAFTDWRGRHVEVADETIVAVLAALDVDASTTETASTALEDARLRHWRRVAPMTVVQVAGDGAVVAVHCRHGDPVDVHVRTESGEARADVEQLMVWVEPREIDGGLVGEATYRLPGDLPAGYHRLVVRTGGTETEATLVVVPRQSSLGGLASRRTWGLAVQLYAARSAGSWGMGDFADLATIVRWAGTHGGGAVLVNPVHAPAPVSPVEPSPYYPATRRFVSPLYLRVEDVAEYAVSGPDIRRRIDDLRLGNDGDLIDRDVVWAAKVEALSLLWPVARDDPGRLAELGTFRDAGGEALRRFALWCVLAEHYGMPWQRWPHAFREPTSPEVAAFAREHSDRVAFHCWLQLLCDEQLARVQAVSAEAAMPVGVIHDLAVGVDPGGADAWSLATELAARVTVGAPPDAFNQQGQNWMQPPWRPDRLADSGYAAYRDMLTAAFRHAGALRVDHVLGLFRLWWIPEGAEASAGTYVRYDADAMLGVLLLEAERAGAAVIGEDLGTVAPGVRDALADRHILGSTVLWFEQHEGQPTPPESWRELAAVSVTTHDMATAAGLLTLAHVELRDRLGLLDRPRDAEEHAEAAVRDGWLRLAREHGLLSDDTDLDAEVLALHALLTESPSRLVLAALSDTVLDPRQPNQPGTVDAYPNWCLPLARATPTGVQPVSLEEALDSEGAAALVRMFAHRLAGHPPTGSEDAAR